MALYFEPCDICHGKPMERREIDEAGAETWVDAICYKCHGTGEYEVETVACKIF